MRAPLICARLPLNGILWFYLPPSTMYIFYMLNCSICLLWVILLFRITNF